MTEREIVGIVGLLVLFVLLMLRIPVGLTMTAVGIGGSYVLSLAAPHLRFEPYLRQFKTLLWNTVANYDLSVVPLFVLMGFLAAHANLSRDLFQGVNALLGRLRGGAAMAAVGACAGFGAVCGSSLATASTMGRVALPETFRREEHVVVDVIDHLAPERAVALLRVLAALLAAALLGLMLWHSVAPAHDTWRFGDRTLDLGLPRFIHWLPILLGTAVAVLVTLMMLARRLRAARDAWQR